MLTLPGNLLGRVHQIHRRHIEAGTHLDAAIIGNLCLMVTRTLLRGNDDHAISGTHTPYTGCGCVFQYRDALYILRVDIIGAILHGESINNDERLGLSIDGSLTTYHHIAVTVNCQTGNHALEVVHHIARHHGLQLLGFHHLKRTGGTAFLYLLVTSHQHFVQHHIRLQYNLAREVGRAAGHRHIYRLHTHIRVFQRSLLHRNLKGVVAVGIGHGAHACLADADRHTHQHLAALVAHIAFDGALAAAQLLTTDSHDIVLNLVVATYQVGYLCHHLLGRLLGLTDGDAGPLLGQVGTVEEVQARLALYFLQHGGHLLRLEIDAYTGVGWHRRLGGWRHEQKQEGQ